MKLYEYVEELKRTETIQNEINTYLDNGPESMTNYADVESLLSEAYHLIARYEMLVMGILGSYEISDLIGKRK